MRQGILKLDDSLTSNPKSEIANCTHNNVYFAASMAVVQFEISDFGF